MRDFIRRRLFCPGPTPVQTRVKLIAAKGDVYHRSEEFTRVFQKCRKHLASFFGTTRLPLILTSSGTGAMEAAVVNFTDVNDTIVTFNGGKFGERWGILGRTYRCCVREFFNPWGKKPDFEDFQLFLSEQTNVKAVFLQANETSVAMHYPIDEMVLKIRAVHPEVLIVVDAISSLVAHEMQMDRWGIDVVIAGSQKGFGIPPGLAFIAISEKAESFYSHRERFYFDLHVETENQKKGLSAWTSASVLVQQLAVSLDILHENGLQKLFESHRQVAISLQKSIQSIGLNLFPEAFYSHALSAISLPKEVDNSRLHKILIDRYKMTFAGGQGALKGKIIRFAHLGMFDIFDIISGMVALEWALKESGYDKFYLGDGVKSLMSELSCFISESS